jgi:hypothetical protein
VDPPIRLSRAAPAAARASPATIGGRGPDRAVSQPLAVDPIPTATLIGRMSSPVAIADSCRDCCRYSEMQIRVPYRHRLNSLTGGFIEAGQRGWLAPLPGALIAAGITPSLSGVVPIERGPSPTLSTIRYTLRRAAARPAREQGPGSAVTLLRGSDSRAGALSLGVCVSFVGDDLAGVLAWGSELPGLSDGGLGPGRAGWP